MNNFTVPTAKDSLGVWLDYLEKSHFKPIDMSLDRIKTVAEGLNLLKPVPYVITVAGTNGKGSTCRFLEMALLKAGFNVGVYSSPHLIHYNERVRINDELLSDETHVRAFAEINEKKTASLTYFEFSTLSALKLFKENQVDVAILEVGLGGRLDATNIVDPDFAVITSIDIDHIAFLGDNREDIGREKAGIFRPNIPVVIGEPDCPNSILEIVNKLQCHAFRRGIEWQYSIENGNFTWKSGKVSFSDLPMPLIPIPNAGTALAVLTNLPFKISEQNIRETFTEAQILGRFQTLTDKDLAKFSGNRPLAKVIIDVGHNPHAARYLADRLQAVKKGKIFAVFSCLEDKELSGIVEPLADLIDEWHCAGLDCWRGQSGDAVAEKLVKCLFNSTVYSYTNVAQASSKAFAKAKENDIVLIFGSFHTVADFILWIEK